jgi:hypothetical protein
VRKLANGALGVQSDRNVLKIISRCVGEIAAANSPLRAGFFMARALRDSDSARAWLTFLDAFERTHYLPPARAEIVAKPLENYAIYGLTVSERAEILRFHQRHRMHADSNGFWIEGAARPTLLGSASSSGAGPMSAANSTEHTSKVARL